MSCVVLQVNTDCNSLIFVRDWEADGTVGALSIPVAAMFSEMVISEEVLEACDTATGTTATTSNPGVL